MSAVSNPFQACNDIFFKPKAVFDTIKEVNNWSWLPFLIVMLMAIYPSYLYMNFVDIEWFKEVLIDGTMADKSPSEQDQFRNLVTRDMMLWQQIISTAIALIVWNAILATYLNLATKFDESNLQGFTDWYGFTWWAAMPSIFGGLISLLVIALSSDHQLSVEQLVIPSLAFVLGIEMTSPWFSLTASITLFSLWGIYLIKTGIQSWVQVSEPKAWVLSIAPFIALWTLLAIFAAVS